MLTVGILRRKFDAFNARYFAGELVTPKLVIVPAGMQSVSMGCGDWGAYTHEDGVHLIEIRAMVANIDRTMLHASLLHEMIHLRLGVSQRHRGRKWNREVRRISQLGALIEVL